MASEEATLFLLVASEVTLPFIDQLPVTSPYFHWMQPSHFCPWPVEEPLIFINLPVKLSPISDSGQ